MCLLVLAWRCHPRYRLVLAGNRDEFHARPSAAADWWRGDDKILAGKDLQADGTWLGVARNGRFAVVTNFREPVAPDPGHSSRGALVAGFLSADEAPDKWSAHTTSRGDRYGGFNLIVGDARDAFYLNNRGADVAPLEDGIHGLSNDRLNTAWPKVVRARDRVAEILTGESLPAERIFDMLADRSTALDPDLPSTGVPIEWERLLSAAFIVSPVYGTRASTLLLVGHDDSVFFEERRFGADGDQVGAAQFSFEIEH